MERWDPEGPIFISYRRADGQRLAELLDTLLRAGGLVPWRDLVDLPPGETAQRVNDAFAGGISSAILLVTPDIGNSAFIPETELPPLLALDADPDKGFQLLVGNTIERPGLLSSMDEGAPDRLLGVSGRELLKNRKQYALLGGRSELRQMLADLLDSRLTTLRRNTGVREPGIQKDKIQIQTQTRPIPTATSRYSGHTVRDSAHDLMIRLRQDRRTGNPAEVGYRCLQFALPLLVDALHIHGVKEVEVTGGGHFSLGWALGAAIPVTRMGFGAFSVTDIHSQTWSEQAERSLNHPKDEGHFSATPYPAEPPEAGLLRKAPSRVAVLIRQGTKTSEAPFQRLVASMPNLAGTLTISIEGPPKSKGQIPSNEGHRLAVEIADILGRWGRSHELHIATNIPSALASLIGRRCNTLDCVLYELGLGPGTRTKHYQPMIRVSPGTPGGPITEVFPGRRFSLSKDPVHRIVNLTPDTLHLIKSGRRVHTWPAAESDLARVEQREVRRGAIHDRRSRVPLSFVTPELPEAEPPEIDGIAYIVPYRTAAASSRADYYFPIGKVHSAGVNSVGFKGLGRLPASDIDRESLSLLRRALDHPLRGAGARAALNPIGDDRPAPRRSPRQGSRRPFGRVTTVRRRRRC